MTETNAVKPASDPKKTYEATPAEKAALQAHLAAKAKRLPSPGLKVVSDGKLPRIDIDHPQQGVGLALLFRALGTSNLAFYDGLINQLVNVSAQGREPSETALNFVLAIVKGIEPKDEVEAMLATQMAAVHLATITTARRLAHCENIPQIDSAERAFNKLARTFAIQMETLKHYRTGGEQRMTVQHLHVNDGGKAIVGTVAGRAVGGGDAGK